MSDDAVSSLRVTITAPKSVYDGCAGVIVRRTSTGSRIRCEPAPPGWPDTVWFGNYEFVVREDTA